MTEPMQLDIEILQGAQFQKAIHWYGGGKKIDEIEALTVGCPTAIKVTAHDMPNSSPTPIAITGVKGAHNANTKSTKKKDMVLATFVDVDNFTIEAQTRGQKYSALTGCIEWYQPKGLANWTARLQIRAKIGDTATLVSLTSGAGDIVINTTDARITFTIDSVATAALNFTEGVYDLELIDPSDEVTRILEGKVTLRKEVTR